MRYLTLHLRTVIWRAYVKYKMAAYSIRNDSGRPHVVRVGMTEQQPELMAYQLLALHGAKAIDVVIRHCDEAARDGAEETLSFWNDVLNVMYGWR